jgi:hypothetical protein
MRALLSLALILVAACQVPENEGFVGGQSGEDPGCTDTVTVGLSSDTLDGVEGAFSADDLLAVAEGAHDGTLTWEDGSVSALTVDVTWDGGEVRLVDSVYEGTADTYCSPRIEVDVAYAFTTADGLFSEAGTAALAGTEPAVAGLAAEWTELEGTFQIPSEEGPGMLYMGASFQGDGAHGELFVVTVGEEIEGVQSSSEEGGALATW